MFCEDNASNKIWRSLNFADKLSVFKLKIPKGELVFIMLDGKLLGKEYGELLIVGGGKTFPAFPAHAQPAILRIW